MNTNGRYPRRNNTVPYVTPDEIAEVLERGSTLGQAAIHAAASYAMDDVRTACAIATSQEANSECWKKANLLEGKVVVVRGISLNGPVQRLTAIGVDLEEWSDVTAEDERTIRGKHFIVDGVYELDSESEEVAGFGRDECAEWAAGVLRYGVRLRSGDATVLTIGNDELLARPVYGLPLDSLEWQYPASQHGACL